MKTKDNNLVELEEEFYRKMEKEDKKKRIKMKVEGRGVFELQKKLKKK